MPLNWTPNHDPRSREYGIRAALPLVTAESRNAARSWPTAAVLNQGADGACVGYAIAATLGAPVPEAAGGAAEQIYAIAKTLDQWPGEAYEGTSVTAGGKAAKALGYIESYRWAFGAADVVDTLATYGPVVLGLYWTERMMHPVNGLMSATGAIMGGHCTIANAYHPAAPEAGGRPAIRIQNSYGTAWGIDGAAWLPVSDLTTVLQRQGEAMVLA